LPQINPKDTSFDVGTLPAQRFMAEQRVGYVQIKKSTQPQIMMPQPQFIKEDPHLNSPLLNANVFSFSFSFFFFSFD